MSLPKLSDLNEALGHAVSDKRLEVLRRVGESGSISQAAREAGISYKAAWQAIDTLTSLSGVTLVERTVGGSGGGGARITPQGQALLQLAQQLAQARQQVLDRFAGGPQLAGGLGLRTSMRNQLPCEVLACEPVSPEDPTVRVRLRTAGGAVLSSSLTRESADLLGLRPGLGALVLCKATAVRIALGDPPAAEHGNHLAGRIDRIARGQGRDEVVLALDGGGQWVGFAEHPFAARRGQRAWASMPAAALVLGLAG
jgi:molybdate transport system regulatory protein